MNSYCEWYERFEAWLLSLWFLSERVTKGIGLGLLTTFIIGSVILILFVLVSEVKNEIKYPSSKYTFSYLGLGGVFLIEIFTIFFSFLLLSHYWCEWYCEYYGCG